MSVVVARPVRVPEEVLEGHDGFGLVSLTLEDLEACGQWLVPDPYPTRLDPDHAFVCGPKKRSNLRGMATRCRWVVRPERFPWEH